MEELHHQACEQAGEDPKTLANRLFNWELKSDWDSFSGSAETYAEVFGPQGLAEYRRLAEKEWKKLTALVPGDDNHDRLGSRFRITSIMESLARQSGDLEALVAVKRQDLSHPYSFLELPKSIDRQANTIRRSIGPSKACALSRRLIRASQIFSLPNIIAAAVTPKRWTSSGHNSSKPHGSVLIKNCKITR